MSVEKSAASVTEVSLSVDFPSCYFQDSNIVSEFRQIGYNVCVVLPLENFELSAHATVFT